MQMNRTSTGSMQAVRICSIEITTKTGAVYVFPDFPKDEIFRVLSSQVFASGDLTLTNVSGACLVIALRIVEKVTADGEVVWKAPSK